MPCNNPIIIAHKVGIIAPPPQIATETPNEVKSRFFQRFTGLQRLS
jgi:hypothetical protein